MFNVFERTRFELSVGGGDRHKILTHVLPSYFTEFHGLLKTNSKSSIFGHTITQQTRKNDLPTIVIGLIIKFPELNWITLMTRWFHGVLLPWRRSLSWFFQALYEPLTIQNIYFRILISDWKNRQGTVSRKIVSIRIESKRRLRWCLATQSMYSLDDALTIRSEPPVFELSTDLSQLEQASRICKRWQQKQS